VGGGPWTGTGSLQKLRKGRKTTAWPRRLRLFVNCNNIGISLYIQREEGRTVEKRRRSRREALGKRFDILNPEKRKGVEGGVKLQPELRKKREGRRSLMRTDCNALEETDNPKSIFVSGDLRFQNLTGR